jgi:hypothetical protein
MENLIEIILKIVGFIVLESLPEQVSETLKLSGGGLFILLVIVALGQSAI